MGPSQRPNARTARTAARGAAAGRCPAWADPRGPPPAEAPELGGALVGRTRRNGRALSGQQAGHRGVAGRGGARLLPGPGCCDMKTRRNRSGASRTTPRGRRPPRPPWRKADFVLWKSHLDGITFKVLVETGAPMKPKRALWPLTRTLPACDAAGPRSPHARERSGRRQGPRGWGRGGRETPGAGSLGLRWPAGSRWRQVRGPRRQGEPREAWPPSRRGRWPGPPTM